MTACIFCSIIEGKLPAEIVHRDENVVAFLDTKPLFHGHVLVVPTKHVVTLGELEAVAPFFDRVKELSLAVPAAMDGEGSFVANNNIVSQSVPHLHFHVVPRKKGDGLKGFFWPRRKYAGEELAETGIKIRQALDRLRSG